VLAWLKSTFMGGDIPRCCHVLYRHFWNVIHWKPWKEVKAFLSCHLFSNLFKYIMCIEWDSMQGQPYFIKKKPFHLNITHWAEIFSFLLDYHDLSQKIIILQKLSVSFPECCIVQRRLNFLMCELITFLKVGNHVGKYTFMAY
jgi:hypothetical protein